MGRLVNLTVLGTDLVGNAAILLPTKFTLTSREF